MTPGRAEGRPLEKPGKRKAIRVIVPGRPVPKARPRLGVRGRTAYIYTPENTRAYEQLVGMCARAAAPAPLQGPVEMRAVIYLCRGRRGDLDNYLKCLCDGLNGIAWLDDGQEYSAGITFDSRDASIMFLARLLAVKYAAGGCHYGGSHDLAGIGVRYASDPRWAEKVAGCMKRIAEDAKTWR